MTSSDDPILYFPITALEHYQRCKDEFPDTVDLAYNMVYDFLSDVNPGWAAVFKQQLEEDSPDELSYVQEEMHLEAYVIAECLQRGFPEEGIFNELYIDYPDFLKRLEQRRKMEALPPENKPSGPYRIKLKGGENPLFEGMKDQ